MTDVVMPEQWLPVVGYEGTYEVSDLGRVRSLDRAIYHVDGRIRRVRGCYLAFSTSNAIGHLYAKLHLHNVSTSRTVHSLVAEAFLGPRPKGLEVRHGPGGATDNRAANLSYGTHSENIRDQRRDGTNVQLNKTRCLLGHPLRSPNLVRSALRTGRRACKACCRGKSRVRDYRVRYGIELDVQVETDRYLVAIMRSAT